VIQNAGGELEEHGQQRPSEEHGRRRPSEEHGWHRAAAEWWSEEGGLTSRSTRARGRAHRDQRTAWAAALEDVGRAVQCGVVLLCSLCRSLSAVFFGHRGGLSEIWGASEEDAKMDQPFGASVGGRMGSQQCQFKTHFLVVTRIQ
jgi:hypothetical protein